MYYDDSKVVFVLAFVVAPENDNQLRVKSSFNKLLFCLTSENHTANFNKSIASCRGFHFVEWSFHLHKKNMFNFLKGYIEA